MQDMIVAAMQENRAIIKAHIERMVTIFEASCICSDQADPGGHTVRQSAQDRRQP
ncbi:MULTISPECIES: hypothetical protein [unclassified Mesorhizobium]|uniref:hypothetical protein n=1 Tax=unclassified Mesorhizobium TaxID=325217 RepID=UPI0019387616|nr:hypothetical protein MesoLjLa_25540 [Mesorhizobium sp. L-2-11]